MEYYFLSHRKNYKVESQKGIINAPIDSFAHARLLIKELNPGDKIVHYNGNIYATSTVLELPKKNENVVTVKVKYKMLKKAISKDTIKKLLKDQNAIYKYGPFNKNLDVNQGYLFNFRKDLYNILFHNNNEQELLRGDDMSKLAKNQILYGPPGCGKTYETIIKAIEIIDNNLYKEYKDGKVEYQVLKNRFNELKKQERIAFVTFHQSYSYEEFVEGIKPILENDDRLNYINKPGIFKTIAQNALFDMLDKTSKDSEELMGFEKLKEVFINDHPINTILKTDSKQAEFKIIGYTNKSIRITPVNGDSIYSISYDYLEKILQYKVKARSEIKKYVGALQGLSSYYFAVAQEFRKIKTVSNIELDESQEYKNRVIREYYKGRIALSENSQPYVLIIDEINRGNISKIFGELITLIEDDKRIGCEHQLTTILPYSQDEFGIPKNLYIIGTMNTSDRSIASVDIALRRRFKFVEKMPDPDKVIGDYKPLFELLNQRISVLSDRDHQIGHSYFMNKDKSLKEIWYDSIMPLLNEYFYGDWDKLQAILGKAEDAKTNSGEKYTSFIKKINAKKLGIPASCYCDNDCYDFVSYNDIDFESAIHNATLMEYKEE